MFKPMGNIFLMFYQLEIFCHSEQLNNSNINCHIINYTTQDQRKTEQVKKKFKPEVNKINRNEHLHAYKEIYPDCLTTVIGREFRQIVYIR